MHLVALANGKGGCCDGGLKGRFFRREIAFRLPVMQNHPFRCVVEDGIGCEAHSEFLALLVGLL
jgi:hypothetical protein